MRKNRLIINSSASLPLLVDSQQGYPQEKVKLITEMASSILPSWVGLSVSPVTHSYDESLFPIERLATVGMHNRRLASFVAGRVCAKRALQAIGAPLAPIIKAASGAPVWPKGFVGSISHNDSFAIAISAKSAHVESVGIDLEDQAPLDDGAMLKIICTPYEIERFDGGQNEILSYGKLLFVIKEAVYKAFYPIAGKFLDFQDVSVDISANRRTFIANLNQSMPIGVYCPAQFFGKIIAESGFIFSYAYPAAKGRPGNSENLGPV